MKAKNVLAELREAAIVPIAESAPAKDFDDEIWTMRTMTDELVEFRLRAATTLKGLLSNRKPANATPEGAPYQAPAGARVCDLAYILLHRMLRWTRLPQPSSERPRLNAMRISGNFKNHEYFARPSIPSHE